MGKKTCPICGSRKWHKNRDGQVVCEDGHVLQGVRSESQVMTEPTGHALQKRRILKGRERGDKRKLFGRADKTVYRGRKAEWLRVQGLQLLLRHQVAALQKLWAIPDALEAIARDLWTYQLLISQVTPEPTSRSPSPQRLHKSSRRSLADDVTTPSPSDREDFGAEDESEDESESGSENESETGSESDDELDADLRALEDGHEPMISDEEDEDPDPTPATNEAKEPWKRSRPLRISDVLSTVVLALYMLRVPFTFQRIEELICTLQIPYIDFANTTLIPADMVRHMNHAARISLRPQRPPSVAFLFKLTREFARILRAYFGVPMPEVNLPPVAWLPLIRSDPVIGMPKWEDWVAELDRRLQTGAFKDGDGIDRFLDRAEHVLLSDRDHGPGGARFPLPTAPKSKPNSPNSWEEFHERTATDCLAQAKPPPPDTPNYALPLLPGEAVQLYGPTATLPQPLAIVVAAAAAVVGVDPEAVREVVTRFERRIERARPKLGPTSLIARKLRPAALRESRNLSSFSS
ncbi:uncharacterized protein CcaverHIS019_0405290 [Cutaneotrichosporon cavernicola]|uniref:Rrn7/TAF1B N-terminal cyclin domain-containing protein n=1 Tax=Cutaneotrichosporon cavernicola TaxID=279322 RepID=A0AA48QVU1_9TREE|nr:uncharacterized protein CcaverHIS019_0405290 [Cutaneotrichosporon cavernicola]BEI91709.1 hypothetical protein CcaverHIS019_0405290 [Cutaneotrichosporon cavernicola]